MEIEYVLLLSAHCKCVVPFYKSALSHPKQSAKKRPFSRITQEKGRSQALFSSGETPISSSQRST